MDRASSMPPKKPRALTKRKQGAHHATGAPKDGKLVAVKRSKHTPVEEFVHVVENKQWVRRDRSSLANSSRKKGSVPAPAPHRGARAGRPAACSLPGTPFEPEHPLELPLRRGSSTGECLETRTPRALATAEFLASASAVPPETPPSAGRAAADALSASLAAAEARIGPEEEGSVTRRRAAECGAQMAERREQLEREQLALDHAAQRATAVLLEALRDPLGTWGAGCFWQLAMCEFAAFDPTCVGTSREMAATFRQRAASARSKVPVLSGSYEFDALQQALQSSEELQVALMLSLDQWKGVVCAMFDHFGRFTEVAVDASETLLSLLARLHVASLEWRKPGRPPMEVEVSSKAKGAFTPAHRAETAAWQLECGPAMSLATTARISAVASRRMHRMTGRECGTESKTSIWHHLYQSHYLYRMRAKEASFNKARCFVQWDEVCERACIWGVDVGRSMHGP